MASFFRSSTTRPFDSRNDGAPSIRRSSSSRPFDFVEEASFSIKRSSSSVASTREQSVSRKFSETLPGWSCDLYHELDSRSTHHTVGLLAFDRGRRASLDESKSPTSTITSFLLDPAGMYCDFLTLCFASSTLLRFAKLHEHPSLITWCHNQWRLDTIGRWWAYPLPEWSQCKQSFSIRIACLWMLRKYLTSFERNTFSRVSDWSEALAVSCHLCPPTCFVNRHNNRLLFHAALSLRMAQPALVRIRTLPWSEKHPTFRLRWMTHTLTLFHPVQLKEGACLITM